MTFKFRRIAVVGISLALFALFLTTRNYSSLRLEYDWYRFQIGGESGEPERATALARHGDALEDVLVECLRSPRAGYPKSASKALHAIIPIWNAEPGRAVPFIEKFCRARPTFSPEGRTAFDGILPDLLGMTWEAAFDPWKAADAELRSQLLAAIRKQPNPRFDLAAVRLGDPEPEIRRAALLIVGPGSETGADAVETEAVVRFLHDPDAGVRDICESCLKTRNLSAEDIGMARRLTAADPRERLELLLDLRRDRERSDLDRWLDRLSRDGSAAVRLGTARVAAERGVATFRQRLLQMSAGDPDGTVRQQAEYYLGQLREDR